MERMRLDEIVLFQIPTMLVLASQSRRHFGDSHRFEKLSTIIKRIQVTARKFDSSPRSLKLVLRDGGAVVCGKTSEEAFILAVLSPAKHASIGQLLSQVPNTATMEAEAFTGRHTHRDYLEERMKDAIGEIVSFKSVLNAIFDPIAEVDPHLL